MRTLRNWSFFLLGVLFVTGCQLAVNKAFAATDPDIALLESQGWDLYMLGFIFAMVVCFALGFNSGQQR